MYIVISLILPNGSQMMLYTLPAHVLLSFVNIFYCLCGRQRLVSRDEFSDEGWKKMYYLSGGNGTEMRWLMPFMQWRLEDSPYADSPYASKKSSIS